MANKMCINAHEMKHERMTIHYKFYNIFFP